MWFAVLELEGRGTERINSTPIRERVAELTGEVRTRKSVLISLDRLTKAGVLEATAIDDWRGGYDWRTTERGRRICEAFVREWARVLEIGDTTSHIPPTTNRWLASRVPRGSNRGQRMPSHTALQRTQRLQRSRFRGVREVRAPDGGFFVI